MNAIYSKLIEGGPVFMFPILFLLILILVLIVKGFIDKNKVVDNFTVEIKMMFPSMQTFTDIMDLMGLSAPEVIEDAAGIVIYHKFKFVKVDISDSNTDHMVWEFTNDVVATYNTKDQYGDYVTFTGMATNTFQKCRFEFERKVKSIQELVKAK